MGRDGRVGAGSAVLIRTSRSEEDVVSGRVSHAEELEEGGAEDDEEEDAEQPGTDLRGFLFFLHGRTLTGGLRDLSRLAL